MLTDQKNLAVRDASGEIRIGLLGYGEVGKILAEDLRRSGFENLFAFDIKCGTSGEGELQHHAKLHGVNLVESVGELGACDLIVSAVTASQTVEAAAACATAVRDVWFIDLNSASPSSKIEASELIGRVNGRYVEAAVMSAVPGKGIHVPMLLGGPHAEMAEPLLRKLGFDATAKAEKLGIVSATKLCRSVMIKGLEALTLECYAAARAWGVEEDVLRSLGRSFPGTDFEKQGAYFFLRAMKHGKRRAEEMREAVKTVEEVEVHPWMSAASAEWQEWIAEKASLHDFDMTDIDWRTVVDQLFPGASV